jgi:hypothetical protein
LIAALRGYQAILWLQPAAVFMIWEADNDIAIDLDLVGQVSS